MQADWYNSDHLRLFLFLLHPAHCGQPQRLQMMRKSLGQRETKHVLFVVKMVHVFPALQVDRYLIIVHPTMTQISTAQVVWSFFLMLGVQLGLALGLNLEGLSSTKSVPNRIYNLYARSQFSKYFPQMNFFRAFF